MSKDCGAKLIARERKRQIEEEGWSAGDDEQHDSGELSRAAAVYAKDVADRLEQESYGFDTSGPSLFPTDWPWDKKWWKPTPDDPVRQLVKAGALIAAEIDRIQALGE
jgi:hypothetical protein